MLILSITGLVIYRKFWRNLFSLKKNRRRHARLSELHKKIGVLSTPVLLILALTGGYWNFSILLHELEHELEHDIVHSNEQQHHAQYQPPSPPDIDELLQQTKTNMPDFVLTYLVFAYEQDKNVSLYGKVSSANPLFSNYSSGASFDASSHQLIAHWDIRDAPLLTQLDDSTRPLHFGNFASITSRIIWALVGLTPLFFAFSGIYLWWSKKRKRQK